MYVYSNLLKKVILPIADKIMHSKLIYYLKIIEDMNGWSKNDIISWQNERLQQLILHFYNNSKYFFIKMEHLNLVPNDIKKIEDLKKLPVLTKKEIVENYCDLIPMNIVNLKYKNHSTGGSTGNPLKFLLDINSWSFTSANKYYNWSKLGFRIGEKFIAIGSTSLLPAKKKSLRHDIYYLLINKIPLNGINMSDNVLNDYANIIFKKNIKYIYGYASSIYLLADYFRRKNIDGRLIKAVFPTSEILSDFYRDTIYDVFKNSKIMDCYGAHDGGVSAFELEHQKYSVGYNCLVELKNKLSNGMGSILATDILNYAFPFIRYEIGDEISMYDDIKQYNSNGQLIKKIYGRVSNVIRLENGRVLTGPGFTVLFKDLNVNSYNIRKSGNMEIEICIKKSFNYKTSEENLIMKTFKKQAGEGCKIIIKYVDDFNQLSSGKRNYFIS